MCKNAYEEYIERSGKIMLFCKLLDADKEVKTEMMKLCICQRFWSDKDQYITYKQKEGCNNTE